MEVMKPPALPPGTRTMPSGTEPCGWSDRLMFVPPPKPKEPRYRPDHDPRWDDEGGWDE